MFWFCFVTVVVVLFVLKRWHRMTTLRRHGIPGPSPNWLLGNANELFGKGMCKCFEEWKDKYGDIVGFYIGGTYHVAVMDIELIKKIQITDSQKFFNRNHFIKGCIWPSKVGQSNLFFSTDETWTRQRKFFNTCFTPSKLRDYVQVMMQRIDEQMEKFSNIENREIEIVKEWTRLTMANSTKALLGLDVQGSAMDNVAALMTETLTLQLTTDFGIVYLLFPELEFLFHPIRRFIFSAKEWLEWTCLGKLFAIVRASVNNRRANPEQFANDKHFLQRLVDEKSLSDDEVVGMAVNATAGAQTASAVTLAAVCHHLTNHRNLQDELREEAQELMDKDGELGYNALFALPKISAFIDETTRLYPAAALAVSRCSSTNYEFHDDHGRRFVIPRGTGIIVGAMALQLDERYWEDPLRFDPDRFRDGTKSLKEPFAYQTFGHGPRQCPGTRFALLIIKLAIVRLLLKYEITATSKSEIGALKMVEEFGTIIPENGVFVKLVPRG